MTPVIEILERIIKAYNNNDEPMGYVIEDAINVLGYDPSNPIKNYEVCLNIEFEATNPEEAVRQFIKLVFNSGLDSEQWMYVVKDEDDPVGEEVYLK